jgi:hypothetical protein
MSVIVAVAAALRRGLPEPDRQIPSVGTAAQRSLLFSRCTFVERAASVAVPERRHRLAAGC